MEEITAPNIRLLSPWIAAYGTYRRLAAPYDMTVFNMSGVYIIEMTKQDIPIKWKLGIAWSNQLNIHDTMSLSEAQTILDRYLIDQGYKFMSNERWERIQLLL